MAKKKKYKSARQQRSNALQVLGIFGVLTAVVFMPTTIVLFFSMLPTLVASLIDRGGKGTKTLTIGAMNIAGASPYLLDLWTSGHTPNNAMSIIFDPNTIIVCYSAAGFGYIIDWAMGKAVRGFLIKKANLRLESIQARQNELVARWGKEVSGELPLDPSGFPIEDPAVAAEQVKR